MVRVYVRNLAAVVFSAAVLFGSGGGRALGAEQQLLPNPTFKAKSGGWVLRSAVFDAGARHGASAGVRLDGVKQGPDSGSRAGVVLSNPPTFRPLQFTCYVKGSANGQRITVDAIAYTSRADMKARKGMEHWGAETAVTAGGWAPLKLSVNVPSGVTVLTLSVINQTGKPAYVSDARMVVGPKPRIVPGVQILADPTFNAEGGTGWVLRSAALDAGARHGASAGVRLEGVPQGPSSWSHAGVVVPNPPTSRPLQFTCYVKGSANGQPITVNAFAFADSAAMNAGRTMARWNGYAVTRAGGWTPLKLSVNIPAGATVMTLWVINHAAKPAYVSDASLVVGR
jgi:hypothetical protein